jgi:WhiB family redox-sensing transcriptional regulator
MPTAIDLLRTLTDTPNLPGAACVEHRDIFDACLGKAAGRPLTYTRAIRVCARCPALRECFAWVSSLPASERPYGVTAGIVRSGRR